MAENTKDEAAAEDAAETTEKKGFGKILVWLVVGIVGIGAGFATPMVLMSKSDDSSATQEAVDENQLPIPDPNEPVVYIPFDKDVVVNFNEPRFSRFFKDAIFDAGSRIAKGRNRKLLVEKHDVLINWVIGHIADLRVEDIRGTQGTNRLRREIHDSFNSLLFGDGIERIQDVLFQELNIQ